MQYLRGTRIHSTNSDKIWLDYTYQRCKDHGKYKFSTQGITKILKKHPNRVWILKYTHLRSNRTHPQNKINQIGYGNL